MDAFHWFGGKSQWGPSRDTLFGSKGSTWFYMAHSLLAQKKFVQMHNFFMQMHNFFMQMHNFFMQMHNFLIAQKIREDFDSIDTDQAQNKRKHHRNNTLVLCS
jgi:hypothetical protein